MDKRTLIAYRTYGRSLCILKTVLGLPPDSPDRVKMRYDNRSAFTLYGTTGRRLPIISEVRRETILVKKKIIFFNIWKYDRLNARNVFLIYLIDFFLNFHWSLR